MDFLPTPSQLVARARGDLRVGMPVVLRAEDGTGIVLLAAETATPERLAALRDLRGDTVVALTERRAMTLRIRCYDGDMARVTMPEDVGAAWLRDLADPARDLSAPMKGPLDSLRDGDAAPWRAGLTLAKSAQLLPAIVGVALARPALFAVDNGLTCLDLATAEIDLASSPALHPVAAARLPMAASEAGRLRIFRPENGGIEHYAIEIGRPDRTGPVLTRLHSACFTGDVLGSLKCDCGPQLHAALAEMAKARAGVLLYLNQEGRGIGLANKMRAYALQDEGFDTVEANHRLGFEDDERDFRIGAALLREMKIGAVRLMTNNPRKVEMMEAEGIEVAERVPLVTGSTRHNAHYLATKAKKSGHLL